MKVAGEREQPKDKVPSLKDITLRYLHTHDLEDGENIKNFLLNYKKN